MQQALGLDCIKEWLTNKQKKKKKNHWNYCISCGKGKWYTSDWTTHITEAPRAVLPLHAGPTLVSLSDSLSFTGDRERRAKTGASCTKKKANETRSHLRIDTDCPKCKIKTLHTARLGREGSAEGKRWQLARSQICPAWLQLRASVLLKGRR